MDFVYPYIRSEANGNELLLSIASVRKNFSGKANVIVIGDAPPSSCDVQHIPTIRIAPQTDRSFKDQIAKLKIASSVSNEFIWMMDDIFFIKPVNASDLKISRHDGSKSPERFHNRLQDWRPKNRWLELKKKTMLALHDRGFTTRDHSTHCPHFLDSSLVLRMFENWNLDNEVWEWKTIYGNVYGENPQPCRPFRWRWKGPQTAKKLKSGFSNCQISNCNSSGFDGVAGSVLAEILGYKTPTGKNMARTKRKVVYYCERKGEKNNRRSRRRRKLQRTETDQAIAEKKDSSSPCPGNYRGDFLELKNNRLCSRRKKQSVPVFQCNLINKPVTIEPYQSGQKEGCCKRCDVFWGETELPVAVTSLIPRDDPAQRRAIETWRAHGLEICAVQTAGEIEHTNAIYPEVNRWIELPETGKPKVSSVIRSAYEAHPSRNLMLINADIEIHDNLPSVGRNELVAGTRIDYGPGSKDRKNRWGLDVFFMSPEAASQINVTPFKIGEPVWDYWIPFHFLRLGFKIRIVSGMFRHRRHAIRWSKESHRNNQDVLRKIYGLNSFRPSKFRKSLRRFEV